MAKYQWKSETKFIEVILRRSAEMGLHNASLCIL